jgi:hypothetical protein
MALDDILGPIMGMFGGGGGGGGLVPQQPAPQIPGTTPPTFPIPGGGGGGNILGSLIMGVGAPLISRLIGGGDGGEETAMQRLMGIGKTGAQAGKTMVKRASRGELTDPQQAMVDRMKAEQNARWAQHMSNLGIPVSSSMVQAQNLVDTQATELANKLINESFEQGIKALGLAGTSSSQYLTNAMKQKEDLSKAIGEMMRQAGTVLNPQAQPGTPAPGSNIQQQATTAAQAWGGGGEGDYGWSPEEYAATRTEFPT